MTKQNKFTKRETELISALFSNGFTQPNYYSGTGRFSKRSADHAQFLIDSLKSHGMVEGRHFRTGNTSPRGGHSGKFVKLLAAGRKLKSFDQFATSI